MTLRHLFAIQSIALVLLAMIVLFQQGGPAPQSAEGPELTLSGIQAEQLDRIESMLQELVDEPSRTAAGDARRGASGQAPEMGELLKEIQGIRRKLALLATQAAVESGQVRSAAQNSPANTQKLLALRAALRSAKRPSADHGLYLSPLGVIREFGAPTNVKVDAKGNAYWEYAFSVPGGGKGAVFFHFVDGLVVDVVL
ncbi:MAG: hypothetical protein CSA62_01010 [Planctomycetota bacterium]|nr:MAG: hypothetical protein CSA62_01010 [Planctomycetota bacterium]